MMCSAGAGSTVLFAGHPASRVPSGTPDLRQPFYPTLPCSSRRSLSQQLSDSTQAPQPRNKTEGPGEVSGGGSQAEGSAGNKGEAQPGGLTVSFLDDNVSAGLGQATARLAAFCWPALQPTPLQCVGPPTCPPCSMHSGGYCTWHVRQIK